MRKARTLYNIFHELSFFDLQMFINKIAQRRNQFIKQIKYIRILVQKGIYPILKHPFYFPGKIPLVRNQTIQENKQWIFDYVETSLYIFPLFSLISQSSQNICWNCKTWIMHLRNCACKHIYLRLRLPYLVKHRGLKLVLILVLYALRH